VTTIKNKTVDYSYDDVSELIIDGVNIGSPNKIRNNPNLVQILSKVDLLKTLNEWDDNDVVRDIVRRAIIECNVKTRNELSACYESACNSWMVDNEHQGTTMKDYNLEVSYCKENVEHVRKFYEKFYKPEVINVH